jgi:transcriptional regulator with XRE-family HTH domain
MQAFFTQQVNGVRVGFPLPFSSMNYKREAGKRLKAAREDKKLTLGELSKRLGGLLSPSRLSNYEQGTRMIGVKESIALAPILGVQPSHLLCVDIGEGEMTVQETELLRNFRALPERDRNDYARRIGVLALAYREPVPDEKLSEHVRKGTRYRRTAT